MTASLVQENWRGLIEAVSHLLVDCFNFLILFCCQLAEVVVVSLFFGLQLLPKGIVTCFQPLLTLPAIRPQKIVPVKLII